MQQLVHTVLRRTTMSQVRFDEGLIRLAKAPMEKKNLVRLSRALSFNPTWAVDFVGGCEELSMPQKLRVVAEVYEGIPK